MAQEGAARGPRSRLGLGPAGWFLVLAFFVSAFNLGDRLIIGVAAEPIKREFGLSDTLLGLLSGTAFALVYPPLGLPIAWLADRFSRRNILVVSLAVWSAMTTTCGLATGFWSLLLARVGVAAGEAGYAPTTHALIAHYFTPTQRARAFSVLTAGGAVGTFAASSLGGWAAAHYGWRAAFLVVGAPGLLLALLILATVSEPPRRRADPGGGGAAGVARLLRSPAYVLCIMGSALHLMVTYAGAAWTAPYILRTFHLGLADVGLLLGLSSLVGGVGGGLAGGLVGDWLAKIDRRWLAWWPAVTVTTAIPFGLGAYTAHGVTVAVSCIFAAGFLNALYQSSTYTLVQDQADARGRATAAALMIFVQNILGLGLGPVLVGALSDHFRSLLGGAALGAALSVMYALNAVAAVLYLLSGRAIGRSEAAGSPP